MAPTAFERRGAHGAASSTHHLATATAMAVLARGGNAFDAVVAAGFVLQVVEPHMCGPGGEVPIVFVTADDPTPRVLCGQGVVPAGTTIAHLRDELGLEQVPGTGLLPATVPGAWDAWLVLLRDHGTWRLADVLEPAIGYAAGGFPVLPQTRAAIDVVAAHFRAHWPGSAQTWLSAGETHRLPVLAQTWQRLLKEAAAVGSDRVAQIEAARAAWYRGFVAEEIDRFCRTPVVDETGRAHAGRLTADDLAGWSATYEEPVVADAGGGWAVVKPAAWSQGPVLGQLVQLLPEVRYVDGRPTAETVHTVVEAAKLAFADREAWYGDDAPPGVLADLLAPEYAARRRALIGAEASWELRPGSPGGRTPALPTKAAPGGVRGDGVSALGLGEPTIAETGRTRGDTVHVDVVDAAGNMVSATPSGAWLQSSPAIPALGFCLGTRAQMTWLEEGLPSSLVPGKRPRTTLSPTLALRDGEPVLAFGTPGGDQQDQWQLCFWLAHTAGGLDLQAAIDSPAWHSTAFPSSFAPRSWAPGGMVAEDRLGAEVLEELRRRGHAVTVAGGWTLGRMCAVGRGGGMLRAAADRRSGYGGAAAF
ncbi:gamma-glutamyltranspeptidase / glutathione hydrolase [Pseudonocardia thermophila]|uniref:Gamma-glutamyltranspeptidase / glutathione hydrolase n=1 Tax=Pseudonocardia thermophila TaxID=1848 RepID=A0A1M6VBN8_PSETH|nr:gamma-glutamyltransferase [Pseudonocardia thermophila]SHK78869.1 gamma-glutamyltranspeptidase / glutathione hydrolase [Pseudonocardia thermophila]